MKERDFFMDAESFFAGAAISAIFVSAMALHYLNDEEKAKENNISIPFDIVAKCGIEQANKPIQQAIKSGNAGEIQIGIKDGQCDFTFEPHPSFEPRP